MQMKLVKSHDLWVPIAMIHICNTKKKQGHPRVQKDLEQDKPQIQWKAVKT